MQKIKFVIFSLVVLGCISSGSSLAIEPGIWTGTLTNTAEKSYKQQFNVSISCEQGSPKINIEMINLELEPKPDFTYQLEHIEVQGHKLKFDIPQQFDTRACQLELVPDEYPLYKGTCVSSAAQSDEKSRIVMKRLDPNLTTRQPECPKFEVNME